MSSKQPEDEFPPEIRAAFQAYSAPRPSPGFDARFWAQLEARQNRYRGFAGFLRRVWELEIEGVAVWRLALSTLSGGASCALVFALALGVSNPQIAPVTPPADDQIPATALHAFAFYRREWEAEFWAAPQPSSARPRRHQGNDFSWNRSNPVSGAPLA